MLAFITILIAILLTCLAIGAFVFIYRKIVYLPLFWRNTAMILFFAYTSHYFSLKWTTISLLYLSVCIINFILQELFHSSKTRGVGYKTIYSTLLGGNNGSFYNHGYSNYLRSQQVIEEQQNESFKFNKLILCAFVPLWLIYFLSQKTVNKSFKIAGYFYSNLFGMKNKMNLFLKNIKAA
jgi:hypothetical protein